jgi:hypothetical protein
MVSDDAAIPTQNASIMLEVILGGTFTAGSD